MNSGFSIYTFPDLFKNYWRFLSLIILCLFSSCGYKVNSVGSNLLSSTESVISGVISPLVGSIAEDKTQRSLLINNAYSAACADPVYAKLFRLESDGSVNDNSPLDSQLVSADAKYSFDLKALSVTSASQNIEYLVKVEGCNGDVYKRPVTAFDKDQNLDARTTVIAEVINSNTLLSTTLNQVDKKEILNLIESVSGTTLSSALASLTNTGAASSQFRKLFGVNPSVILSAKPEVQLISPYTIINELALSVFSASTFHVDPNYSFAYSWKLDGVVKSTSSTWNYIPSANNSGDHQVDLYVGIDDGTGHIDTAKPYYTKIISIHVNNNILPIAPSITLNSSNPSPVNTNTIAVDLNTGVALTHCSNFSHMAFTDTPTLPGIMQFNIDCSTSGTQTENITFSTGDGSKTIYLWAMDNEGTISAAKTLS
nr:hypothetical protein [Bacteriovorax sp.]